MRNIIFSFFVLLGPLNLFGAGAGDAYELALSQYQHKDYKSAVTNLKVAIQVDESNWKAHQLLGYCNYMLNDQAGAWDECKKSLELLPDNPQLRQFTDRLVMIGPKNARYNDSDAYLENKELAQMPSPPDLAPGQKRKIQIIKPTSNQVQERQLDVPNNKPSIKNPAPPETFFVKTSGGFDYSETILTRYNPTAINENNNVINTYIIGFNHFTGSLAAGVDFPGQFSLFASSEWYLNDWAMMANGQFTYRELDLVQPYFYLGLGMDVNGQALGPVLQLGLGVNAPLGQNFSVFVEAKSFFTVVFYNNNNQPSLNCYQWEIYLPLMAGLKVNF